MKRFILSLCLCLLCSASYADVATNLVHWWKFDESSGSALDSSGSANTGTLTNTPTRTTGKIGPYALSFVSSSSQYVSNTAASNLPALNGNSTYAAWVYVSASGSGNRDIITLTNSTPNAGNQFRISSSGYLQVSQWGGTTTVTGGAVSSGTWHHVAWTYDGTTNRLYIDGVASTTSTTAHQTGASARVYVGTYASGEYFYGYIDDVRVYSRALTADDITQLYSYSGKTGFFVLTNEN